MRKICIIFLLSIIISLTVFGSGAFGGCSLQDDADLTALRTENEYLRIHIRADSNAADAQAVKYCVRDEVVTYLTPLVAEYQTKTEALRGVREKLDEIAEVADKTLRRKGFSYGATAELTVENFPTRVYGEYVLPAGEYAALILRLGSGEGDNWWCVVYPPLCFAAPSGQNVVYKSKIWEIIKNFKK